MGTVSADLVLNIDEALSQIEALGGLISEVTSDVAVTVDTTEAEGEIQGLASEQVEVPVDADVSEAAGQIDGLDAETVEVPVEADTSEAEGAIDSLDAEQVDVPVVADTADAEAALDAIPDPDPVELTVEANTAQAEQSLSQLSEATEGLGTAGAGAAAGLSQVDDAAGSLSLGAVAAKAGVAGLAAAAVTAVTAFADSDRAIAVATQRIESLGTSAVTSVPAMTQLSDELRDTAGVSDEAATEAQTLLLTFGNLSDKAVTTEENFQRATKAIFDISTVQGNARSNAIALGKALEDPVGGLTRLERAGITFTDAQKELIESLVATGDVAGAQAVILDEIEDKYGGLAVAAGESLAGQLAIATEALGEMAEAIGGALAPAITSLLPEVVALSEEISTGFTNIGQWVEAFGQAADRVQNLDTAITDLLGVTDLWGGSVSGVVDTLNSGFFSIIGSVISTATDLLSPIQSGIEAFNGLSREVFGADKAFAGFDASGKGATTTMSEVDTAIGATTEAIDVIETATAEAEAAFQQLVDGFLAGAPDISSAISEVEGNLNDFGETIDSATDARLVLDNLDQSIEAFRNFADNLETIGQTSTEVRDVLAVINPEIAGGLAEALASGNPALIRQFETRIRQIRRFGGDAVELFGGQATDSAEAWEDGLRPLPNVTRSLTERSIRAVEAQRNNARGAGRTVGDNMTDGVERGVDGMSPAARRGVNEASNAARAARNTAASGGRSVGNALTEGMAEGIVARIPAVTAAARNAVAAAVQAAQNEAGISSPSKVFMAMGEEMVEGMALGLMDVDPVVAAAAYLADAAISEISQKKNEWDAAILGPSGVLPEEAAKATWLANADPSFSAIYMPAPADDGGQRDGTPVYNFTLNIDAANQDPVAVGDAVVSAVEASLFRASVVGARRRRG